MAAKVKRKQANTKASRQLDAEWEAMQERWATVPKFARTIHKGKKNVERYQEQAVVMKHSTAKSLVTPGGSTAPMQAKHYTSTKVLGVAVMHKSCLVPIFSSEEADDVAHMRR
jgi:hypothetical protein